MMSLPPPLEPGELIGVFAAASPVQKAMLEAGVEALESFGFSVRLAPGILSQRGYLAGSDQERAASFNALVGDSEVRVLWAARGGYGSGRIIDQLDLDSLGSRPVVGSSDLTALSLALRRRGRTFIHGAMVASDAPPQRAGLGLVLALLTGRTGQGTVLGGGPLRIISGGPAVEVVGTLEGGCLSLLAAACGTRDQLVAQDAICLIEEVNERPFRIDRMLQQLKLSGAFEGVRAVIFGEMPGCEQEGLSLDEVLVDVLGDLDVPLLSGLPTGHVEQTPHHPMPHGRRARITNDRLLLVEPVVDLGS